MIVLVGFYGIFVTFIIIMQATDVVDLLLDCEYCKPAFECSPNIAVDPFLTNGSCHAVTAMEFVSALDDSAFLLCLSGFLGTVSTLNQSPYADIRAS